MAYFDSTEKDRYKKMIPLNPEPYLLPVDQLAKDLNVNLETGISSDEAAQRLAQFGLNALQKKKGGGPWPLFFSQFNNFIIWVLLGAALVSGVLQEWVDTVVIVAIVLLNAVMGFVQEYKAEKSLEALKKLSVPKAKVYRDKNLVMIPSEKMVPGDLILLEAGDSIPADARLVSAFNFSSQEASLTGESHPVSKQKEELPQAVELAERRNMVYQGTSVASGKGKAVVTATGMKTELGKIAALLQITQKEETPLQRRLEKLGKKLVVICLAIIAVVFVLGIWEGESLLNMFMTAVSLAVAAIPEGLPAVVTMALAFGVKKMVKRNAIIRKLPSVETLGCATVICSDKTGTLTQNEMTVRNVWADGKLIEVSGSGYEPKGDFLLGGKPLETNLKKSVEDLFRAGVLCNGAELVKENGIWKIVGDPTEGAILTAAMKLGQSKENLEGNYKEVGEIPFDSNRKMMSVICEKGGEFIAFVKGAPDVILKQCSKIQRNGEEPLLNTEQKEEIVRVNEALAEQALRVLGIAQRRLKEKPNEYIAEAIETELVFLGLVAMIDPPRPEVKEAVRKCKEAGIRSVMITGDHQKTAMAIGKELGFLDSGMEAVHGQELDQMSDEELRARVDKIAVYARTTAEHKMRIVQAWKARGEIVAMTGDGVNDAPAIKQAAIGIGMGITGTDVTKEVSDMVITDDNFASIVNAVEEGRGIYDNIKKFVNYLLCCNLGEVLVILMALIFQWRGTDGELILPLLAIQILWMNLVTDGLPAVALALDPVDPKVMKRKPRSPDEKILSLDMGFNILAISLLLTAATLVAFHWGLKISAEMGRTMAFTALVLFQMVSIQLIRSLYSTSIFSNPFLILAVLSSLGLQLLVIYTPLRGLFHTVPIEWQGWLLIAALSAAVFVIGKIVLRLISVLTHQKN